MTILVDNSGRGTLNLRFKVSLKPGVNKVDSDAWDQCKKDDITKHYLSSRQVRVVSGDAKPTAKPEPPPVAESNAAAVVSFMSKGDDDADDGDEVENEDVIGDPETLLKMNAKDAIAFVKGFSNYEQLEAMLEVDERSTVAAAIEKRLSELDEE